MLRSKVAIVTGSTSGIGLGIARELAKLGSDLVLNGFGDAGEIDRIRCGIEREHGVRVVYNGADMANANAVRGLIDATVDKTRPHRRAVVPQLRTVIPVSPNP